MFGRDSGAPAATVAAGNAAAYFLLILSRRMQAASAAHFRPGPNVRVVAPHANTIVPRVRYGQFGRIAMHTLTHTRVIYYTRVQWAITIEQASSFHASRGAQPKHALTHANTPSGIRTRRCRRPATRTIGCSGARARSRLHTPEQFNHATRGEERPLCACTPRTGPAYPGPYCTASRQPVALLPTWTTEQAQHTQKKMTSQLPYALA